MNLAPVNPTRYRRRRWGSAFMEGLCVLAAGIGVLVLVLILFTLLQRGLAGLSLSVFTHTMKSPGGGGGLSNAILGSLLQTGLGALIGAPLGIAVGIYLAEIGRNSLFASAVRFVNDILLSAPSVLVGLFIYQIVVVPSGGFSGYAGAIALALLATPVAARTTEDIMRLLPDGYRDGATALGARQWQTIFGVLLPAASGGLLTGVLLAVARISGETAPLIFTSLGSFSVSLDMSKPMASLPIAIYRYASSPYAEWVNLAWTGALIITFGVLLFNIASRLLHRGYPRRR